MAEAYQCPECGGELAYVGYVFYDDYTFKETWQCTRCGRLFVREEESRGVM